MLHEAKQSHMICCRADEHGPGMLVIAISIHSLLNLEAWIHYNQCLACPTHKAALYLLMFAQPQAAAHLPLAAVHR